MGKIQGIPIALLLLILFTGCEKTVKKTGTLMDFVPVDASVVFKISNFETLQADVKNNSLLSKFGKTAPYLFFSEKATLLKNLHPSTESLLCINKLSDSTSAYTFISKHTRYLFQPDSIKNKSIETITLEDKSFQRISIDKETVYSAVVDSVFVASSSQKILLDILNGKTERDNTFKKMYNLPTSNDFTALIRGEKVVINDSVQVNFSSWSSVDLKITPESFTATGISLATDSIPQLLNVFEGQVPQQNDVSQLMPIEAEGAISFTFNDPEKFQKNLRTFRMQKDTVASTGIFGSVSEVGTIQFKNETVTFIKSIDALLTSDALARYVSAKNMFREIEISTFSEPLLFQKTFTPLIANGNANYVFQLENFFVFTESEATAEEMTTSFLNNATVKNTPYFENISTQLSSASSLLIVKSRNTISGALSGFFGPVPANDIEKISLEQFPFAVLQFTYDRNFAHVTAICNETSSAKTISSVVGENIEVLLENSVLGAPQFFTNHQNGGSNIVVQDSANKLYFISESGKVLWTKKLDSAILGSVQEVDIYGNGNKQMAFASKNTFYILDRNGNDVGPFPLKFKDKITQPLSVFDYDNNNKYRFIITQGKNVLMYDKTGKIVKGFGFTQAKSKIVLSPKHIRMNNKDYIVIAQEDGKLNILNRVGKSRVAVSKTFKFSEIPVTEEDNTFVVITKENTKERISESGKTSSQKLNVGLAYWFAVSGNTKATLDGNLLRINGKLAELPLGVYTRPQIFNIDRKTYVTVTETQENKVFVLDKNAKPLSGFPIYGTGTASLGKANNKKILNLVVKGGESSIILYQL